MSCYPTVDNNFDCKIKQLILRWNLRDLPQVFLGFVLDETISVWPHFGRIHSCTAHVPELVPGMAPDEIKRTQFKEAILVKISHNNNTCSIEFNFVQIQPKSENDYFLLFFLISRKFYDITKNINILVVGNDSLAWSKPRVWMRL